MVNHFHLVVETPQAVGMSVLSKCETGVRMWTAVAERSGDTAFYCRRVNPFYRRWFFQKRRRRFALPAHSIERSGKLGPALVNVMLCSHQPRQQTINHLKVACEDELALEVSLIAGCDRK